MQKKKNDETKFVVSRSNDINELYHYGVKGMKWGSSKISEFRWHFN